MSSIKLKKILSQLIEQRTISGDKAINNIALNWIKGQFKGLTVFQKEFIFDGFESLLITTRKTLKPELLLVAHLDVVPGSEKIFKPVIKNNRLFGRGASDMKFAIACYIKIFQELASNLNNYNLGILIVTDEELGSANGVPKLLKRGIGANVCFLPDNGGIWRPESGAKGGLHIIVESRGKSGHGSQPWLSVNAIDNLLCFVGRLQSGFPKEPCRIKNHYHNTINVGKIAGGKATNQVADFASANIDIRFIPGIQTNDLWKMINNAKGSLKGITVKEAVFVNSYQLDSNNRYFALIKRIVVKQTGIKMKTIFSDSSSDARFFVEKGIPTISFLPNSGSEHSEREWIDLKDLERFYSVLKEFTKTVAKI